MKTKETTAEELYAAFKELKNAERKAFLEKVIHDPGLRDDLIDIALVEKSKRGKGKAVSARGYFENRRR